jgi:hypothetical protein
LDAVVLDTSICDATARNRIRDVDPIAQRIDRARIFLDYLNRCAQELTDVDAQRVWGEAHAALARDIADVEEAVA